MAQQKIMNKEHQKNLFNILKSVVEHKLPPLKQRLEQAKEAQTQIPKLEQDINAMSHCIDYTARFDPSDNDGEDIIRLETATNQLHKMKDLVRDMPHINAQIDAAKSFNDKYTYVMSSDKLGQLYLTRAQLVGDLNTLSDKIESAEINIDTAEYRNPDLVELSTVELIEYRTRYDAVQAKYDAVCKEIFAIEKFK